MTKTNNYLQNTDYILLSSDGVGDISLLIQSGLTVPGFTNRFFESFTEIGNSPASPLRSIFKFNNSPEGIIATSVNFDISVTYSGITTTFPLFVSIERVGNNTIRLYALISNTGASTMTINSNTQIDVKLRTFKSPFNT